MNKNILIGAGVAITLLALIGSAMIGPKLVSTIVVGFGGEGANRYSTDGFDTGLEFAPNMYHAESYEAYTQWKPSIFKDGKNMQSAPAGTVPRGGWYVAEDYMPYHLPNTPEAYDSASAIKNPLLASVAGLDSTKRDAAMKKTEDKGKKIYETYCLVCHGEAGAGDGILVKNEKIPTPGAYSTKVDLTDGKMFHSITYGKNLMGSYASQITPEERWQVIYYIRKNFLK